MNTNKKRIPKRAGTILLAVVILLCQTIIVYIPAFQFLDAINYNILACAWDNFKYIFTDKIDLYEYRESYELISEYVYQFVDEHPDFYSVFDGGFYISKNGITFYYKDTYPDYSFPDNCYYDWEISDPKWPSINYWDAYPTNKYATEPRWHVFPDVITHTGWMLDSMLVYSRSGRLPSEFIRDIRSANRCWRTPDDVINIIKHTGGWYELHTK